MSQVRPAAVAGHFYPGSARELRPMVEAFVAGARPRSDSTSSPKAVIAPHAGYVYSGPTAGYSFSQLRSERESIRKVVLLGPAHRVPVRGLALPAAEAFETPLGSVPVDRELADRVRSMPQVNVDALAHEAEHSLEVEIPFLQMVLADFTLLPLVVGLAEPAEVSAVLERVWGGAETRIVVSSDLSHYQHYDQARQIDHQTAEEILRLEAGLSGGQACGAAAVNGLLMIARRRGLKASLLDLRNSGDTAGGRAQVVGYGAFAFYEVP